MVLAAIDACRRVTGLLACLATAAVAQEPVPDIFPIDQYSGGIEIKLEDGTEQTWMVTRLVDVKTGAPLSGKIAAFIEHNYPEPAIWEPLRQATTSADGWIRMRIDDLLKERGLWLVAEAEGYAPSSQMSATTPVPWELTPGYDIPIEVRSALGYPVANARVGWHLGCGHTHDVRQVTTDTKGQAIMRGVVGDDGELWVHGSQLLGQYADFEAWLPGRGRLVIHREPAPTWRGVLVDANGKAVAGWHVGVPEYHRGPWVLTDQDGRFTLDGLNCDEVYVANAETKEQLYFELPPRGVEARFVLAPEIEEAEEVEEDEKPENFRLRIEAPPGRSEEDIPVVAWCASQRIVKRFDVTAGEDHTMHMPPGSYELRIGGKLSSWRELRTEITVADGGESAFQMALTAQPKVRMWLDRNSAFARAVADSGSIDLVTATDVRSIEEEVFAGEKIAVPHDVEWAVRLRLFERVRHVGNTAVDARGELELTVPEPYRVRVRLADASGQAVRGKVRIAAHPRGHLESEHESPWSSAGSAIEFTTWMGPGRWLLLVEPDHDGWRAQRSRMEVDLPATASEVFDLGTVILRPAIERGLSVSLPDGTPAAGVAVVCGHQEVDLDEQGVLPEGSYAAAGDEVTIDLDDDYTIPLRTTLEGEGPWKMSWPAGSFELSVSDEEGEAIDSFAVHIDQRILEGGEGSLKRRGLALGSHEVVIAAQGYAPVRITLDLAPHAQMKVRLKRR